MSASADSPPRKRGRPRDPEIRAKVLTAASSLFMERGYDALTMEGIVAAAGVAKQTLYRGWPSKSAVVAEAIVGGFLELPNNPVPRTPDIWNDLRDWLGQISDSMRRPYGEVLRASIAISTTDPVLGTQIERAFGRSAVVEIRERLVEAVQAGQISKATDLDATVALLMAIIVFEGTTRQDGTRLPSIVDILKSGIAAAS